jgi:hypothetical protein
LQGRLGGSRAWVGGQRRCDHTSNDRSRAEACRCGIGVGSREHVSSQFMFAVRRGRGASTPRLRCPGGPTRHASPRMAAAQACDCGRALCDVMVCPSLFSFCRGSSCAGRPETWPPMSRLRPGISASSIASKAANTACPPMTWNGQWSGPPVSWHRSYRESLHGDGSSSICVAAITQKLG